MNDKQTLRQDVTVRRKSLDLSARRSANEVIVQKVLDRPEAQKAHVICVYESLPTEVDTSSLIDALRAQGKTIVIPPKQVDMFTNIKQIDVFIVPGVAFDVHGNRLGRGSGYYDRVLARVIVPTIGIAYDCQIVSGLPKEKYDIPITTVITEKETYGQNTP